jgi:hypothetical protein
MQNNNRYGVIDVVRVNLGDGNIQKTAQKAASGKKPDRHVVG